MSSRKSLIALALSALALAACAGRQPAPASAPPPPPPTWAFEQSDVPLDEGHRFGRLDNGMRYRRWCG